MNDSISNSNRYAIRQNNVGVSYYMATGNVDVAQDHFREALASKLATENQFLAAAITTTNSSSEPMEPTSDMDTFEDDELFTAYDSTHKRCISPNSADAVKCDQHEASASIPYLYLRPFAIKQKDLLSESTPTTVTSVAQNDLASIESVRTSLIILFNLALTHHKKDHTSMKAYSIYKIAITLLLTLPSPTDSESLLLHVAVLNNYGVWCYENHEFEPVIICFEELTQVVDDACYDDDGDAISTIDIDVKRGIYRNVRTFLME